MPRLTVKQEAAAAGAALVKSRRKLEAELKKERALKIGAIEEAGALLLTWEQLAGFLIPLRTADDKLREKWDREGEAYLDRVAAEAARPKQVVEIVFPDGGKGPKDADMRPLKWSALRKSWEGFMNIEDARRLARSLGGSVKGDDALPIAAE